MQLNVRTKTFGLILLLIVVISLSIVFIMGYYSVPPKILPDSRVVHAEEENIDIVIIHVERSGWFENLVSKINVGKEELKIYNSTHLQGSENRYFKYIATGVVTVTEKPQYGKVFQISGRGEPYDGYIIFWGSIFTNEELNSDTIEVSLERYIMWLPGRPLTISIKIDLIQRIESGEHPRLIFTRSDLPQLRASILLEDSNPMEFSYKKVFTDLKDLANTYLTERFFTVYGRFTVYLPPNQPRRHSDNFPYWTGITRQIQARLEILALVYLITGDRVYADRAKEFMLFLSGWSQWTDPDYRCAGPRTCLDIGHLSMGVALAYDWIYDTLDEAERFIIRDALISKGIIPSYIEATEQGSWLQNPWRWPNGYAIVISGLGMASLAVLEEDSRAETWLETAVNWTVKWLNRMGSDGGYTEGHTYATYATDFTSRFLYALLKIKGINLFDHPFMRNVPYFAIYSISPDGSSIVNLEDASYGAVRDWKETLAIAASLYENRFAQWYLKKTEVYNTVIQSHGYDSIYHFIGFNPQIAPLDPDGRLPPSKVFRSIGWAIFRTGWKEDDVLFAFKCGPWGSHHHRDAADFVLNYQGVWLAAAPGYRLSTSTEAHNTLLVGGTGQEAADGYLIDFFNSSLVDFVSGNASKTYGSDVTFIRQILFVRPNLFIISDHVTAGKEVSVSWLLHAEPFSTIEISGISGKITRREKILMIHMNSPQELSVSIGKTEDLPYIRYDASSSRRIRFLASLNPISNDKDAASVRIQFYEDYSLVNFSSSLGSGLAIFAESFNHSPILCKDVLSDSHVFGYTQKSENIGFFLINGTYLNVKGQKIMKFDCLSHGSLLVSSSQVISQLYLEEKGWIQLYSPTEPTSVRQGQVSIPFTYNKSSKMVKILLEAGYHQIILEIS
ncbi:TPA: DUF4962 domain-containing protein [Candidatus Bathyarchaeota archaeon]|nr:DUF4962 domain-containing protein [Candidatus Bathyarchaeota archaeon]